MFSSISATYINLIKISLAHMKLSLALQQNDANKNRIRYHFTPARMTKT